MRQTNGKRLLLNIMLFPALVVVTIAGTALAPLVIGTTRAVLSRPTRITTRRLIRVYGKICVQLISCFVPLRTENLHRVSDAAPCVIVANHQSAIDQYIMGALPAPNAVVVVKDWPFRIPFYGWFMRRAGYLNSEKLDQAALLQYGADALAEGASVLFFPEGTRSKNGKLGRFRSGAFKLAVTTGRPLVPICLDGVGRFLPPGSILFHDTSISVVALPPQDSTVYAQQPFGHVALRRKVKAMFTETLEQLR